MKNFKKKWLLPIMAIALAVGGAFATNVTKIDTSLSTVGYLSLNEPCDTQVICGDSGQKGCTISGFGEAFGMANNCTEVLFRP
jgi:hypothetical protein